MVYAILDVAVHKRRPVAGRHHRLAARRYIVEIFLMLLVIYEGAQTAQSAFLVLRLVACLGTLYEYLFADPGVGITPHVAQTHTRLNLVDVLSAGSSASESIPLDFTFVDFHVEFFRFRKHSHSGRRSVDTSLGLGGGHPLHAVNAALVFHGAVDVGAGEREDNLLETTRGAF